ncbi:unnamed protein product [Spirodela intermedia]|uniref:Uncharacterized protein n=1 Tax=Spirodela intermedia TaxID=51605 RepID=A0A7I8J8J2_SPIIN|nr:unnamed protein product [Spirodela intermedia]CAA6666065.1 unnamed protein product [Spirodela intermedia]
MGRATRWLRSLLGGKKDTNESKHNSNAGAATRAGDRVKKRWSFDKSEREQGDVAPVAQAPKEDSAWLQSLYSTNEKEQSKHAIAVAAATAAAADAAVAAAQAAVAVVRLTNQGRGSVFLGGRERWAAMKIQALFRGYLAKKALRALKALVKLQQAAATLHCMQALIRAQSTVRMQRSRNLPVRDPSRLQAEVRPRRSLERFDETRSECAVPTLHSRRLSASLDQAINGFEGSPKIVEIDPGRPKSRNRRPNTPLPDAGDDFLPHTPPLPCQLSSRISSIPDSRKNNPYDFDWSLTGDECRFSTAQSTPRFLNSCVTATVPMPLTPAKSVCGGDGIFRRYQNLSTFPNYMAKTQSFEAKRLPLNEMTEPRASLSSVRIHRSCSQVQEAFNFKNAVVGRLDRSADLCREIEREYYLQRRW